MDKEQIRAELDRVRNDFRDLLDTATVAQFAEPSDGTRWTNEQLLFHMLFGYLLVRSRRLLVRGVRLGSPTASPGGFAAALNSVTGPFDVVNDRAGLLGRRACVLGYPGMERLMDRESTAAADLASPGVENERRTGACTSRSDGTPTSGTT